jgi:hypothetical protein
LPTLENEMKAQIPQFVSVYYTFYVHPSERKILKWNTKLNVTSFGEKAKDSKSIKN